MRKYLILSTILPLLFACTIKEKPEFVKLENIKVDGTSSKLIRLTADAYFRNPNDIKGELKTDGIKILINNNEWGTVISERFKVPAQKEFSMPLEAHIPIDSLISNKNLIGLLGSLISQEFEVQYIGQIKYKVFGFSHYYDVNQREHIRIKI